MLLDTWFCFSFHFRYGRVNLIVVQYCSSCWTQKLCGASFSTVLSFCFSLIQKETGNWNSIFLPAALDFQLKLLFLQNYTMKFLCGGIRMCILKSFIFYSFWYFPILKIEENASSHYSQAPMILYSVLVFICKRQPVRSSFYWR